MPEEPYRPTPAPTDGSGELARLAQDGQRRIAEATALRASVQQRAEHKRSDRNVRIALGAFYGAPVHVVSYALMLVTVVAMAVVGLAYDTTFLAFLTPILLAAFVLRLIAPPRSSRARLASERAWVARLPFTLEGYFEALGAEPEEAMRLALEVVWTAEAPGGAGPDPDAVLNILGVVDTAAAIVPGHAGAVRIQSGSISGSTGISVSSGGNYTTLTRNTRVVRYVHRLVDEVLMPLHRTRAIGRVSVARA